MGGRTSDKHIVEHSGFLDKLDYHDTVLADKGFEIEDLLKQKGVKLNVPPKRENGE